METKGHENDRGGGRIGVGIFTMVVFFLMSMIFFLRGGSDINSDITGMVSGGDGDGATDVLVWRGQYFIGTAFQTGTYEFNFTVYDAAEGGNACYSNRTTLATGSFGEWETEQYGVSSSCSNASKGYYLGIR